jgi:hypothetical protein
MVLLKGMLAENNLRLALALNGRTSLGSLGCHWVRHGWAALGCHWVHHGWAALGVHHGWAALGCHWVCRGLAALGCRRQ